MAELLRARKNQTARGAPALTPSVGHAASTVVEQALRSGAQPLATGTRSFMEPRFGHDFSQVRVHADARSAEAARALSAHAFTVGQDVVFASGQYAPTTAEGQRLIAHELTHVVQQDVTSSHAQLRNGVALSDPSDPSEQAAGIATEVISHRGDAAPIAHAPVAVSRPDGAATVQRDDDDEHLKLQTLPPGLQAPLGPLQLTMTPGKANLDYQHGLFNAGAEYQYGGPVGLSLGYGAPLLPWRSDLESDVTAGATGLSGLAGGHFDWRNIAAASNALSTLGDVNDSQSKESWGVGLQGQYSPEAWKLMLGLRANF